MECALISSIMGDAGTDRARNRALITSGSLGGRPRLHRAPHLHGHEPSPGCCFLGTETLKEFPDPVLSACSTSEAALPPRAACCLRSEVSEWRHHGLYLPAHPPLQQTSSTPKGSPLGAADPSPFSLSSAIGLFHLFLIPADAHCHTYHAVCK